MVTIGTDGELRVWAGVDDDDCESFLVGDEGLAVCVSEKKIFVGSSSTNVLSGYSWELDSEGVVGPRFTSDVTALSCMQSGEVVVAGCGDFSVNVIKTSDFSSTKLTGHSAPVLSVSLARQGEVVASSSCDGTVKVSISIIFTILHTLLSLGLVCGGKICPENTAQCSPQVQ